MVLPPSREFFASGVQRPTRRGSWIRQPYQYEHWSLFVGPDYPEQWFPIPIDVDAPFVLTGIDMVLRQRQKASKPSTMIATVYLGGQWIEVSEQALDIVPSVAFGPGEVINCRASFRPGSKLGNFRPRFVVILLGYKLFWMEETGDVERPRSDQGQKPNEAKP